MHPPPVSDSSSSFSHPNPPDKSVSRNPRKSVKVDEDAEVMTRVLSLDGPMGFSRQEYRSGLPCLHPGDLPSPGNKLMSPALTIKFFTTSNHLRSPQLFYIGWINNKVLLYSTGNYVQYPVINLNRI